jgi:hypothetical protein
MPGMRDMAYGKDMDDEEESESEGTGDDEFDMEAKVALDPDAPMGDRMMALKEAIKLCMKEDYGDKGGKTKGVPDLMMILGKPKKRG